MSGSRPPSEGSSSPPLPHRHTFTSLSTDGTRVSLGACRPLPHPVSLAQVQVRPGRDWLMGDEDEEWEVWKRWA